MQHLGYKDLQVIMIYLRAIEQLPVEQKKVLRLYWKGARQPEHDPDGEQPWPAPGGDAAMEALAEEWRREQGLPLRQAAAD